mmetsp:Transcript_51356/g.116793  ORF Transcript_51356/g.116793 Transcript_51356/m.116793 type:complete len:474 (-) Transcript_51356:232-1653(-)
MNTASTPSKWRPRADPSKVTKHRPRPSSSSSTLLLLLVRAPSEPLAGEARPRKRSDSSAWDASADAATSITSPPLAPPPPEDSAPSFKSSPVAVRPRATCSGRASGNPNSPKSLQARRAESRPPCSRSSLARFLALIALRARILALPAKGRLPCPPTFFARFTGFLSPALLESCEGAAKLPHRKSKLVRGLMASMALTTAARFASGSLACARATSTKRWLTSDGTVIALPTPRASLAAAPPAATSEAAAGRTARMCCPLAVPRQSVLPPPALTSAWRSTEPRWSSVLREAVAEPPNTWMSSRSLWRQRCLSSLTAPGSGACFFLPSDRPEAAFLCTALGPRTLGGRGRSTSASSRTTASIAPTNNRPDEPQPLIAANTSSGVPTSAVALSSSSAVGGSAPAIASCTPRVTASPEPGSPSTFRTSEASCTDNSRVGATTSIVRRSVVGRRRLASWSNTALPSLAADHLSATGSK